jgi:protein-tyrosine-phosphatase
MTKRLLGDSDIRVESAGMLEYKGGPLSQEIVELASGYDVDLSLHKPRQVSAGLINAVDLILVFDNKQVRELVERFPRAKGKIYTVKNYAGYLDGKDMEDLWEKPIEVFERSIREISAYVEKCVDRIRSS